ncbi:hypothetical protein [Haladaptatus sp. DYF46]|uniref:hypothetical protein n=1 Tax=Haladaptatus sp. DYF46 TaxID=2886041 RepID=UPI001E60A1CA|nr:hypothetical protein [Haladaptatus sp. DYF46]
MSENTTDGESETETENAVNSGSGLKTLALIGVSFIAGYILGKSQSESSLGDELEELGESGTGPMEIEIHDTDVGATTESAEESDETADEEDENEDSDGNDDDEGTTDAESDDEEEE